MFAGNMLVVGIGMTAAANFRINRRLAFAYGFMIRAVTSTATNGISVSALLPLAYSRRGFLFVAGKALFSDGR